MKIIIPNGNKGIIIDEQEQPEPFPNSIMCKMRYTLISQGTEKLIIERNEGKTLDEIRKEKIRLGYCGVGIAEHVYGEHKNFKVGQRVAVYGGPYVQHAEYNVVPFSLAYPLPDTISDTEAAFMGLGAIALHGYRCGDPQMGDLCYVGGLGIIGNLCAQLAIAGSCRVVCADHSEYRCKKLEECLTERQSCTITVPEKVEQIINEMSDGNGADISYLCMAAKSPEPMKQATLITRLRGRIVLLGVIDINFTGKEYVDFLQKEQFITTSKAAGPGRYDPFFEREGIDYPYQYIRWTETRNLVEFMRLMQIGKINVAPLISRIIPLSDASEAYESILAEKEVLGFLITWS